MAAVNSRVRRDLENGRLIVDVYTPHPQGIQCIGLVVLGFVILQVGISQEMLCHVVLWVVVLFDRAVLVTRSKALIPG